jgi:phthiocerol/phenolphthiocerol synthesis type-I polyketide synthase E
MPDTTTQSRDAVAVIGMAGRFPGAQGIEEFWGNLRDGVDSISRPTVPELAGGDGPDRLPGDDTYVSAHGRLRTAEYFDAAYFGFSPREAELTDPQHRLFLECVEEALQDAGYDSQRLRGPVGAFAGCTTSPYLRFLQQVLSEEELEDTRVRLGNDVSFLVTRSAYKLGLTGPCATVQTACSTGLVAIHLACQSLLDGECAMAIAGAAGIVYPEPLGYRYEPGSIASPDGYCRAFDADAAGTVGGNGVGAVVLKPIAAAMRDRDRIRAVIVGSAVNNDGSAKIGFAAPSVQGQRSVIRQALRAAGVGPEDIGYVEAHGTGTRLGDLVELEALTQALGAGGDDRAGRRWLIGSVKPAIGHLDAAAGIAGFIKMVLAIERGLIPPTLHFRTPNPGTALAGGRLAVVAEPTPWPADVPRRAGVSSFGIGGTNAHLILEQPLAEAEPDAVTRSPDGWQLITISARSEHGIENYRDNLVQHLRASPDADLASVAFTLRVGRRRLSHRIAGLARTTPDAARVLEEADPGFAFRGHNRQEPPDLAFSFPGHGTEFPGMARQLSVSSPSFDRHLHDCLDALAPHAGHEVEDFLLAETPAVPGAQPVPTALAQPAIFAVEYALAQAWIAAGAVPHALIGHSLGELTAAAVSGIFRLDDAARLVTVRGRLCEQSPPGAMLTAFASVDQVTPLLPSLVEIAAVNSPGAIVLTGPPEPVRDAARRLDQAGIRHRLLRVGRAFHSKSLGPAAAAFEQEVAACRAAAPAIPVASNRTGGWLSATDAASPRYWGRSLCEPVRFADGCRLLSAAGTDIVLELGQGKTLTTLAADNLTGTGTLTVASLPGGAAAVAASEEALLRAAGTIWAAGVDLDWTGLQPPRPVRRVQAPTYPFERLRYTAAASAEDQPAQAPESARAPRRPTAARHHRSESAVPFRPPAPGVESEVAATFEEVLGIAGLGGDDNFFELGGDSLMALRVIARIKNSFSVELPTEEFFAAPTVTGVGRATDAALESAIGQMGASEVAALLSSIERTSDDD